MKNRLTLLCLLALVAAQFGCKPAAEPVAPVTSSDPPILIDQEMPPIMDIQGHPVHGPHGGELVELGKEAFHAEMVHGDGKISIYILDGSATKAVPIASEKLVVSLKHDEQVASFDMLAAPDANDPAGHTSRFTSDDAKLDDWLDKGAEGAVVIHIEGKSYTGKIAHDHDHSGHDH